MPPRHVVFFLCFCAVSASAPAATPPVDRLVAVDAQGSLQFEKTGPALLQGVVLEPGARDWLLLQQGKPIWLHARGSDRYGRAQVVPRVSSKRNALSWQEQLLAGGLATAYDRNALPKKWLKAERPVATIPAAQAEERVGHFAQVSGRVTRQYKGRQFWYVNFGEDWKSDFSLRIPRRAWRSMGKDFAVRDGERVIARGAVFLDNGPAIEITRPEQLQWPDRTAAKPKKRSKAKGRKPPSKEKHANAKR
jgi:hypothetical protein